MTVRLERRGPNFFRPMVEDADLDERVWGHTKVHRLPSYAPEDTQEIRSRRSGRLLSVRRRPDPLASFIRQAGIPLGLSSPPR